MMELNVCIGSSCHIKGSYNVVQTLQQLIEEQRLHDKINIRATFCMKQCQNDGVGVIIGDKHYNLKSSDVKKFFRETVLPNL